MLIQSGRDAEEFVSRVYEFTEFDAYHHLTTGESRDRLSFSHRPYPGIVHRTTIYIDRDGRWTCEFVPEFGRHSFVCEEFEVHDRTAFVWLHRDAVNEFLMLCEPDSLSERVYGCDA